MSYLYPPMGQIGYGMTFAAANGDQHPGNFKGTAERMPNGNFKFGGTFWITGGTGRFENTTGEGIYWGISGVGIHQLYFDGKLIK